eukprot:155793_1
MNLLNIVGLSSDKIDNETFLMPDDINDNIIEYLDGPRQSDMVHLFKMKLTNVQLIISGDKTLKLNGITKMINAKIKSIDRYIESVQVRIPNTNMRERKYRLTTYIERCICNKYDKLTPDEQEAHEEYENNERPTF